MKSAHLLITHFRAQDQGAKDGAISAITPSKGVRAGIALSLMGSAIDQVVSWPSPLTSITTSLLWWAALSGMNAA